MTMQKRVIFNAGNIVKGGAIQAAVNFILNNIDSKQQTIEWHYVVNTVVAKELNKLAISLPESTLVLTQSPARSKEAIEQTLAFESQVSPHLVFTMFGPCYVDFKNFHLSGFANGWLTHSTFKTFTDTYGNNWLTILKAIAKYCYYGIKIRKADAWIFETETAKSGFINRLKVAPSKCHVVANSCFDFGTNFSKKDTSTINGQLLARKDKLFVALAADYPHKNIKQLLYAIKVLKAQYPEPFKLILTLDERAFKNSYFPTVKALGVADHVVNLGPVNIADLSSLYQVAYASILPSFIETFSAVYPESFATDTPVITTNALFAKEICQDAALYIDPNDAQNIADAMQSLLIDTAQYQKQVIKGRELRNHMLSADEKYQAYINIIKQYLT